MTDDIKVAEDIHKQLADYFINKQEGSMLTSCLVYAEVMDKEGDRTVWIIPSEDMGLVTKMGIAAYLVENFRGQLQHMSDEDDD